MKILDRISLTIFSIIILIISLVTCFIISGWLEIPVVADLVEKVLSNEVGGPIALALAILLALLALKCIFLSSY